VRKTVKRRLSNHVVTRHYRAPEVALLEPEYSSKVDVWAAGCILSEMMMSVPGYREF